MNADRIIELAKEKTATMAAKDFLDEQCTLGRRVTVSVEVYDTKGTSKRGHAATFAEAVAQVKAMLEKHDAQAQQEAESAQHGTQPSASAGSV